MSVTSESSRGYRDSSLIIISAGMGFAKSSEEALRFTA